MIIRKFLPCRKPYKIRRVQNLEDIRASTGRTPAFQALSAEVKRSVARQSLGRMFHVLQLGESVAQDVCAKLVLICEEEEYRNHAAAQAMDEARHHLALVRFMEKMGDEVEEINPTIEIAWNEILASNDKSFLIASDGARPSHENCCGLFSR